jgi:uncharacterized protein
LSISCLAYDEQEKVRISDLRSLGQSMTRRRKGLIRISFLLVAAGLIAGIAAAFGIAQNYGYLRASILTGAPGGQYYALGKRLADRAERAYGRLSAIPTEGSIENVNRLISGGRQCSEMFALIQDGTPVPSNAGLELLGRLPALESLLLLGKRGHTIESFSDLRGASIGIGPEGSGTAYLLQQLFNESDLRALKANLSYHGWHEQARLVAENKLDLAAFVMQEDAELLRTLIRQYSLDIVAPQGLQGIIARYPWLSLGRIPVARYELIPPIPAVGKQIARLATLVVANKCAKRADRIALLMLLGAELPGFVRGNPPNSTASATALPLAEEARQFFLTGEPQIADRYFPWLVNIMSPAYWVYLVMAVTILFNSLRGLSRFRLWRIDTTREKLEAALKELVGPGLTHAQMRAVPTERVIGDANKRAAAKAILEQLRDLRARCQHQTSSLVTPMGDEIYYRYQQSMIDEAITTLATLFRRATDATDLLPSSVVVPPSTN